ncbi:MAG: type I-G CRISPR-associated RAMP protein Csb1/Cas7g [Nitriliruptorales bacterium]
MDERIQPERLVSAEGGLRLVLTAQLKPVGGADRFQPAGFPEIGHVIYDAPRGDDEVEPVCIIDSAASMANHLERVCVRSDYDPTPVDELSSLAHLRCVTDGAGTGEAAPEEDGREVVVTSLTEGHRIASTYFLAGKRIDGEGPGERTFEEELREACGIQDLGTRTHPLPEAWWTTFRALFRYDPNSLVHGVLLPRWQVKIPRVLTAHHEAFGAQRVDRSGVKFDRLGKTVSGQPIFAVDDETARTIRATFVLDLALLRSFGRDDLGLGDAEKRALAALALWKVGRLLAQPFRYRSGCDLECVDIDAQLDGQDVDVSADDLAGLPVGTFLDGAVGAVAERDGMRPGVVDIYWPRDELYRAPKEVAEATEDEELDDEE